MSTHYIVYGLGMPSFQSTREGMSEDESGDEDDFDWDV
jgi:hypothetical protein